MEINWITLTYAVIALFALSGFFKGWWKEAVTTSFLVILLFLLANPAVAEGVVGVVNQVIEFVWQFIPATLLPAIESVFNVSAGQIPYIDPADPGTWLIMMIFFIAVAILVGRSSLPNHGGAGYQPSFVGSILGGLLGGLNGFIIMGLIREYLNGRSLPGGGVVPTGEMADAAGSASVGMASSGVTIQATDVPAYTLLDSYLPWVLMGLGLIVFVMALNSRVGYEKNKDGYRKLKTKQPYGYKPYGT